MKWIVNLTLGVFMSNVLAFASVLPKFYTKTLDNGLQVVAIPIQNNTGVVETNVFYKVGSRNEVMGKSGIAHMLEHLSFKSTKKLQAGEFDVIVKHFGGVNNAATSFDYTRYFIKSTSLHMPKSMELFSELMLNLSLKEDEFAKERDVVLQERLWRTDNSPLGYLFFRFFNTAFVYHPYHWSPIGFKEDIISWKIQDIKDFYKTYYQPQNAILLVSGDINKDEVFKNATKYFASLKNTSKMPTRKIKEPTQDGERFVHIKKDTGGLEWLALGYKVPSFDSKDQVAINVLANILGGQKSSILSKHLENDLKIANTTTSFNMGLKDDGIFLIIVGGNSGVKASRLKKEVLKVIDDLKNGKLKKEDIIKARMAVKSEFIHSLESSSDVASLFGEYLVKDNIANLLKYEEALASISVKDLQDVANKYFTTTYQTTIFMTK